MIRAVLIAFFALTASAQAQVQIQEVTSPGGIDAWLVEDHSIPFVALDIRFQGGHSLDLPDRRGATYLMTGLLEEGAGDLDAQAFAAREEELAARFSWDAYRDSVVINAEMLTETRAASVDLLRAALVTPRFDPAAIERVRGQVLSIIAGDQQDPEEIAPHRF
ncbi:MAG: insulinase family protein, partial [Pseudomonadota bacterium]